MVDIINKPLEGISNEHTLPVEIQTGSWHGRLISKIEQTVRCIIAQLFKLAAYCVPNHTTKHTTPLKRSDFENETTPLERAAQFHQTQLAALEYLRRYKAAQTVSLVKRELIWFLGQMFQLPLDTTNDQLTKFLDDAQQLALYLDETELELNLTLPSTEDVCLSNEEVVCIINEMFLRFKKFHLQIQIMSESCPKGSQEKKQIGMYAKVFTTRCNTQMKIYNKISADTQMRSLQQNEQEAWQAYQKCAAKIVRRT